MNFTVWHFREPDGSYVARCFAFKAWRHTAPSLAESKTTSELALREHIAGQVRFQHFEQRHVEEAA